MSELDTYLAAAARANTQRSYASAIRHFEVEWKGLLPASSTQIAEYLVAYAGVLAISTLKQRLAALAQWHQEQGFPDPTKAAVVRKALKGIQTLHPALPKQAQPLQLAQLEQTVAWLEEAIHQAQVRQDHTALLRHTRDRALLLLGFWRGFRGDEITRIEAQFMQIEAERGMQIFLPHSKGDRQALGKTYRVPSLAKLCPVSACQAWMQLSGVNEGPVFRAINRWGLLQAEGLHPSSLIPLLRRLFAAAGIPTPEAYSSHSLRRGFAGWANANGWDLKTLMEYVGWRDVKSAMRYLDSADPFSPHLRQGS
ncbi:Site-specific recombinase XerD [Andreprevotia lacus DSM 23236]|jgi:integrase|uniref:Site-specific recombinase XerD n=1 Tax=Andreprevotia lacus DSM 23236 TaxID=1121001 RepID=A0A1W1XZW9_9NEIS|nr:site-specific integrase [Andreprevotia lacus]SMC29415.1 Site-specific recombinase XerD [Andreprevotia lacus DSM 23236]